MLLEWCITDDISTLSVKEFDTECNGIYGFVKTSIFDKPIGFIPPKSSMLEGHDNVLYWMSNLVECGICILLRKEYETQLLSYNKLCLNVQCLETIHIRLLKIKTRETYMCREVSYIEALNEIICNTKRFKSFIDENNSSLNQTKLIRDFNAKFDYFQRAIDNNKSNTNFES